MLIDLSNCINSCLGSFRENVTVILNTTETSGTIDSHHTLSLSQASISDVISPDEALCPVLEINRDYALSTDGRYVRETEH